MKRLVTLAISIVLFFAFTLSASAAEFTPIYGIDVSVWQGDVNWGKVAGTDTEFAILRVGYNDKIDAQFENNYNNAKANGVPVGVYMYSYAVTEQAAIEEAEIVLERIKGKQFEYPIYLDIEDAKLLKPEYGLTKEQRTKNALAFVHKMQEHGYYVGVYANLDWFTNYLDKDALGAECELWIAHYNDNVDYKDTAYGMWQYTDKGTIDGITDEETKIPTVDLNICYKDYPTIIKNGGYNGFEKPTLEPSGIKGDVNADGEMNLDDVVVLAQYVAGWSIVVSADGLNLNGDSEGKVDLDDVVWLAQKVAGWNLE